MHGTRYQPGAKSENYLRSRFPHLPPQAFVHYGNYIGDTLRLAEEEGISRITMGIMIGKAVKLAEGIWTRIAATSS